MQYQFNVRSTNFNRTDVSKLVSDATFIRAFLAVNNTTMIELQTQMCESSASGNIENWGHSYEEIYSAANSIGRKFLYNSRGLDVISLLVKY